MHSLRKDWDGRRGGIVSGSNTGWGKGVVGVNRDGGIACTVSSESGGFPSGSGGFFFRSSYA